MAVSTSPSIHFVRMTVLSSAHGKLQWARRLAGELRALYSAHLAAVRYELRPSASSPATTNEIVVSQFPPLPAELPYLFGDVVHNYRSALDHAIYPLARAAPARKRAFPVVRNGKLSINDPTIRGLSPEAFALVDWVQPPNCSGGSRLDLLDHLDRVDKHRLLLMVAAGAVHVTKLPIGKLHGSDATITLNGASPPVQITGVGDVIGAVPSLPEHQGIDELHTMIWIVDSGLPAGRQPIDQLVISFDSFVGEVLARLEATQQTSAPCEP